MTGSDDVDLAIVGGGIIGLATARAVQRQRPGTTVAILEKEPVLARHQTGHNSGVIHSGIYYAPGSLKATLCRDGRAELIEFCAAHAIPYDICGKLLVATEPDERSRLDALRGRAGEHGIAVETLGPEGIHAHEPHVAGIAALRVPSAGIVDFHRVVEALADEVRAGGGQIRLGAGVTAMAWDGRRHRIETAAGEVAARRLVNCAGLQSDRVARRAGAATTARIVPFRGEYFELVASRRHLVRNLVYPVPDPSFPFLGVHFTRMIDGSVHAGPNAVLALKREGYRRRDVSAADVWDVVSFGGFWRLAKRHYRYGAVEVARSASKRLFVRSLRRLVPEISAADLEVAAAGVRAQALAPTGALVDDFLFLTGPGAVHVGNAPSPAATSSLAIGRVVAERIEWDE